MPRPSSGLLVSYKPVVDQLVEDRLLDGRVQIRKVARLIQIGFGHIISIGH